MAAAADSSLPRLVIEAAVDAVAPGGQALRQLALALSADPGALATGAPPVAGKLAAALIARGSAALTVPACTVCGRTGKPLFRGDVGSAVCQRCRSWQLAVACASCGKVRPRAGRDDAGQPVCEVCYRRDDPRRHRQCGACGKTAPVAARGRDGHPDICVNCYKMPAATCGICGKTKACNFAGTSHAVCVSCTPTSDRGLRPLREQPPADGTVARGTGLRPVLHRRAAPPRPVRIVRAAAAARRPARPGRRHLRGLRRDPRHKRLRRLRHRRQALRERPVRTVQPRRRARDLLSGGTGTIAPKLTGVLDAITAARQPRSALNWLRAGAGASLLADVAAGRLPVTHDALDTHPRRRAADYLRHMLTANGALPPRDEELIRAGQWLGVLLETIEPTADRRLVQAYATWHVMRRLRSSASRDERHRTPTAHARNNVRAAVTLLSWLRARGTDLSACGQADIDQWLRTGPAARLARDFLIWAGARGHCTPLTIPAPARATGPAISQDQRWTHVARLLDDAALDPTDRVAGSLLLLYGQPLSRIAAMTTSQITRRDDTTFILLGRHDVRPSPHRSPTRSPSSPVTAAATAVSDPRQPPPGCSPGTCPAAPSPPPGSANASGTSASTPRPDAGPRYSTSPPSSPQPSSPTCSACTRTTAAKWISQAGGDWTRYAAELAREPSPPALTNISPPPRTSRSHSPRSVIRSLPVCCSAYRCTWCRAARPWRNVQTTLELYAHVTEDADMRSVAEWRAFTAGWRAVPADGAQAGRCA